MKAKCSAGQCGRPVLARELCEAHYVRWRRHGDAFNQGPVGLSSKATPVVRFFAQVDKQPEPECWPWTGQKNQLGYGQFVINKSYVSAHRFSYELAHGEIPAGLDVDHTCWNRSCVNPAHLRPATRKQNVENRAGLRSTNKSGVSGVHWDAEAGKWRAMVCHYGKRYDVGRFANLADAETAVIAKRNELFTHNDKDRTPTVKDGAI